MGKVILCSDKKANKPYFFKTAGVRIFTIEELCHSLVRHLENLDASDVDIEMAAFIRDELGLKERGELLEHLVLTRSDLKSRLVVIFCSADLYNEDEIGKICDELTLLSNMTGIERSRRRADRYLEERNNAAALREYRNILSSEEGRLLTPEAYGDIIHNIAVLQVRAGLLATAAGSFLEAYERNGRKDSLKAYLFALRLSGQEGKYEQEILRLVDNTRLPDELEAELENVDTELEHSGELDDVYRMKELWRQERYYECERLMVEVVSGLKRKYREDIV